MASFQLQGLDPALFQPLFELDDAQLRERGICRRVVDEYPGVPCRISLEDAAVGEEVLLLPFEHHPVDSPYRALGPIFVRRNAMRARLAPDEVPDYVQRRLISLRAYDSEHMMVSADVLPGQDVAAQLQRLFDDASIDYIHLHNARPGCYSCLALRR
jgi:hypothetical protein